MRRMTDEEITRTSPPELANLPYEFWGEAKLVPPVLKEPISIRVDADVLSWFRSQGPRYQTRISAVLRAYVKAMKNRSRPSKQSKH
ncbi:MAG: BrnA antitoxin family protein [Gemmatimonadaceae bacterium]|nr:BrnA antitoxin family protein [Gemmatimonadaceae bacterium]